MFHSHLASTEPYAGAVAKKTLANMKWGARRFLRWFYAIGAATLSVELLLQFFVDSYDAGCSYDLVNTVRCWLAHVETIYSPNCRRISSDPRVRRMLRGYQRLTASWRGRTLPLDLTKLEELLAHKNLKFWWRMLCILGYVFLLRFSEALDVLVGYHGSHISCEQRGFLLFLARSKADKLQKGVTIFFNYSLVPPPLKKEIVRVASQNMIPCKLPLGLRRRDIAAKGNASLRQQFCPKARFHGWRHGRVADLQKAGIALRRIQELGRWSSTAAFTFYH